MLALAGLAAIGLAQAAGAEEAEPDAYGNVEAREGGVGAGAAGRRVTYAAVEGGIVAAGAIVATIDAAQLGFEREQLAAQRNATASRAVEVRRQIASLDSQRSASVAQRDAGKAQR